MVHRRKPLLPAVQRGWDGAGGATGPDDLNQLPTPRHRDAQAPSRFHWLGGPCPALPAASSTRWGLALLSPETLLVPSLTFSCFRTPVRACEAGGLPSLPSLRRALCAEGRRLTRVQTTCCSPVATCAKRARQRPHSFPGVFAACFSPGGRYRDQRPPRGSLGP